MQTTEQPKDLEAAVLGLSAAAIEQLVSKAWQTDAKLRREFRRVETATAYFKARAGRCGRVL